MQFVVELLWGRLSGDFLECNHPACAEGERWIHDVNKRTKGSICEEKKLMKLGEITFLSWL